MRRRHGARYDGGEIAILSLPACHHFAITQTPLLSLAPGRYIVDAMRTSACSIYLLGRWHGTVISPHFLGSFRYRHGTIFSPSRPFPGISRYQATTMTLLLQARGVFAEILTMRFQRLFHGVTASPMPMQPAELLIEGRRSVITTMMI